MPEKQKRVAVNAEMMVGVSAVFIGLSALVVSVYEARLMRQETRSEVLPILELSRSYYVSSADANDWRLLLQAENVGIGPAQVRDFRVKVDGEAHPTWGSAMTILIEGGAEIEYGQSSINGRTIPPDRVVTMFDLSNTELAKSIVAEFERFDFEACYCSVFDDCWVTSYKAWGGSKPVERCERDESSFLE